MRICSSTAVSEETTLENKMTKMRVVITKVIVKLEKYCTRMSLRMMTTRGFIARMIIRGSRNEIEFNQGKTKLPTGCVIQVVVYLDSILSVENLKDSSTFEE